jgi:hypothetical protein
MYSSRVFKFAAGSAPERPNTVQVEAVVNAPRSRLTSRLDLSVRITHMGQPAAGGTEGRLTPQDLGTALLSGRAGLAVTQALPEPP